MWLSNAIACRVGQKWSREFVVAARLSKKGRGGKTSGAGARQAQLWATRLAGAILVPFLGRPTFALFYVPWDLNKTSAQTKMFARNCRRCLSRAVPASRSYVASASRTQCRRYSSTGASHAASPATTKAGMLAPFIGELDKKAPSFDIQGDQIRVIKTPAEFYETLKVCKPRV